jgi:nucleoside-diphosphate-sugar epimerase
MLSLNSKQSGAALEAIPYNRLFFAFSMYKDHRQGNKRVQWVITRFVERIKYNQPLTIYGDGAQTRDFVNELDIVDAILSCDSKWKC